eukprot:jgi/Tetstr1/466042/TSEL_010629.t1
MLELFLKCTELPEDKIPELIDATSGSGYGMMKVVVEQICQREFARPKEKYLQDHNLGLTVCLRLSCTAKLP